MYKYTRLVVASCFVAGCNATPLTSGGNSEESANAPLVLGSSPLEPGIYIGTSNCTRTLRDSPAPDQVEESSTTTTIVIGASGLPVVDGQEVAPGQGGEGASVILGLSGQAMVENVTVTDEGVIVEYSIALEFEDQFGNRSALAGSQTVTYLSDSSNQLVVFSSLFLIGGDDLGNSGSISDECSLVAQK